LRLFFKQFSFPGGVGSHCTTETPGSSHEGGELGYVLSHACGAAFHNPDLIVAAVVGDGEAQTGPLATSWYINKFLNPIRDGAVLPILHLNGYKINKFHSACTDWPRRVGESPARVGTPLTPEKIASLWANAIHCVKNVRTGESPRAVCTAKAFRISR
jgi:hypothetical protein